MDITRDYQYLVNSTYAKLNRTTESAIALQAYISSNKFNLGDYSTEITINIPNRIKVYENSDYEETFDTLSSFGAQIL